MGSSLGLLVAATGGAKQVPESQLPLARVLSFGSLEADSVTTLGLVVAVTVGPEGFLYTLDQGTSRLAVFDTVGSFVTVTGRRGRGPGEYLGPLTMAGDGKGDVLVLDRRNARLDVYRLRNRSLELLRTAVSKGEPADGPLGFEG